MPKIKGLFAAFPQLEKVSVDNVWKWLKKKYDKSLLENELGNRILYPQFLPVTQDDLFFDLAILREALKLHPAEYLNVNLKKIFIPESFLNRFPDLTKLVWAFIDAYKPQGIITLHLKSQEVGVRTLGSYIKPQLSLKEGMIYLQVKEQKYQLKVGSLTLIPISDRRVDFHFESVVATLLGKNSLSGELLGGQLGLMIDARVDYGT